MASEPELHPQSSADGVARADTWAVLTGETAVSQEHAQQADRVR